MKLTKNDFKIWFGYQMRAFGCLFFWIVFGFSIHTISGFFQYLIFLAAVEYFYLILTGIFIPKGKK